MKIEKIKEKFFNKQFLKLAIKNLFLIIGIVIFVIVFSGVFGSENQLIGVSLITGLLMFKNIGIGIKYKQAPIVIFILYLIMAFSNIISFFNIYLAIFLNFFTIFIFMLFSTVHLHYKTYIPFILTYIFAQDSDIPDDRIIYRFLALFISGISLAICHYIYNKNDDNTTDINTILKEFTFEKDNYVFTLKMALGVTIAMFFADIIGIQKGMWICITVMSLTQPHFEMTHARIKLRILGTITGFFVYIILFKTIIPQESLVLLVAILSYIYTFIKDYYIQMIFITINSLNAAKDIFQTNYSIFLRISFILLGTIIAFCILLLERKFLDKKVKYDDEGIF